MKLLFSASKRLLIPYFVFELVSVGGSSYLLYLYSIFINEVTTSGISAAYPYLISVVGGFLVLALIGTLANRLRQTILFELTGPVLTGKLAAGKDFGRAWSERTALINGRLTSGLDTVLTILGIIAAAVVIGVSRWELGLIALLGFALCSVASWYQNKKINASNQTRVAAESELRKKTGSFEKNYVTAALNGADMKLLAEESSWRVAVQLAKVEKINALRDGVSSFAVGATYLVMMIVAAVLIYNQDASISTFILAVTVTGTVVGQVGGLITSLAAFLNNKWATMKDTPTALLEDAPKPTATISSVVASHLGKALDGKPILAPVSFQLDKPCNLLLKGPNGSGKTTLARILVGLQAPTTGTIEYAGTKEKGYRDMPVAYQSSETRLLPGTVLQNLTGFVAKPAKQELQKVLGMLPIEHLLDREVDGLSEGETALVKVGILLNNDYSVRVFDEVFAKIDAGKRDEVIKRILSEPTVNVVIAHHEIQADFDQELTLEPLHEESQQKVVG